MINDIIRRILGLRAKYGTKRRTIIQTMDVKSTIRQIGVDPAGTAAFGYVVADYVVVDMRFQFRWRGSPGWTRVVVSANHDDQRNPTRETAVIWRRESEHHRMHDLHQ